MFTHMEQDGVAASTEGEVMAAVEQGPVDQFVLADVGREGAHIRLPLSAAASLPEWR